MDSEKITIEAFQALARERFGDDPQEWSVVLHSPTPETEVLPFEHLVDIRIY